jgi:hypothetical protein
VERARIAGEGKVMKHETYDDLERCDVDVPLHHKVMGLCKMAYEQGRDIASLITVTKFLK